MPNKKEKVKLIPDTDFEAGQLDALNRIMSSLQKFCAEIENTTFSQINALSLTDDNAFLKLRERVSTIKNIMDQIDSIKENL